MRSSLPHVRSVSNHRVEFELSMTRLRYCTLSKQCWVWDGRRRRVSAWERAACWTPCSPSDDRRLRWKPTIGLLESVGRRHVRVLRLGALHPLGVSRDVLDLTAGFSPAVESDLEAGDVVESDVAQHRRSECRALATGAVEDVALVEGEGLAVIRALRIEPELEHS